MAEAIKRQWSVERTILASTALPAVASGALIAVLISSVDLGAVKQHFEEDLSQALRQLLSEGGGLSDDALRAYVQEVLGTVVQLLPALFVLSTAAGALLNYGVVRLVWSRLGQPATAPDDNARTVESSGSLCLGVDRQRYQLFCAASGHADREG